MRMGLWRGLLRRLKRKKSNVVYGIAGIWLVYLRAGGHFGTVVHGASSDWDQAYIYGVKNSAQDTQYIIFWIYNSILFHLNIENARDPKMPEDICVRCPLS